MALTPWDWLQTSFDVRYTHFWAQETVSEAMPEVDILGQGVGNDIFFDTGIDALPNGRERDANGNIVRLDRTIELANGDVVTLEEFLGQNPPTGDPNDPVLELDGSQDDFLPGPVGDDPGGGPEGDGIFSEGEPFIAVDRFAGEGLPRDL